MQILKAFFNNSKGFCAPYFFCAMCFFLGFSCVILEILIYIKFFATGVYVPISLSGTAMTCFGTGAGMVGVYNLGSFVSAWKNKNNGGNENVEQI